MRHYDVILTGPRGRSEAFRVSGMKNAYAPARAFLLVTNHTQPARASVEALAVGASVEFGLAEWGLVTVRRVT